PPETTSCASLHSRVQCRHLTARARPASPTRRSSDLDAKAQFDLAQVPVERPGEVGQAFGVSGFEGEVAVGHRLHGRTRVARRARSEEHTSELQSRENLVCRLLLEKKKINRHSAQASL